MSTSERVRFGGHPVGLPDGVYLAPLGRRLAAFAIDVLLPYAVLLVGVVLMITGGPTVPAVVCLVVAVCWAVLLCWMVAFRAAGPGMRLLGLQLVGLHDGRPIGVGRALVRAVIISLLGFTVVGLIILSVIMVLQPRRQGWHDRAADSVVIEERPLAPPRGQQAARSRAAEDDQQQSQADELPQPDRSGERVDLAEGDLAAEADPEPARRADVAAEQSADAEAAQSVARDEEAAAPPPPDQGWVIILEDGREIPINRLVLIGRNPQPRAGEEDARLIKIVDEARTVSKTHLAINVDARGVLITDRGSTNGSAVTDPDGGYEILTAHEARRVPGAGYLVSFGKHHVRIGRTRSGGAGSTL